jgi:alkanesulfonate monooxygenase SsuD/methylene tetrahydromethanopterin reductase-like flavin-dependent oxidoreductase (luciferase family)
MAERFERMEETLQIAQQMWSDDDGPFAGKHYELAETICVPKPARGRVPILIGGGGERKTLRLVAQYADACNLFASDGYDGIKHKLDVLRQHCDAVGRDYGEIRKTIMFHGDPLSDWDDFMSEMESYAGLGISLVTMMPPTDDPEAWATGVVSDVVPRLKEI